MVLAAAVRRHSQEEADMSHLQIRLRISEGREGMTQEERAERIEFNDFSLEEAEREEK